MNNNETTITGYPLSVGFGLGFWEQLIIFGIFLIVLVVILFEIRKRSRAPRLLGYDLLVPYDSPEAKAISFKKFSIIAVIVLHYLTLGIFSWIWLSLAHGSMPRIRRDDPSAARAFFGHLIPFYNIYWTFFHHIRLCYRINEQRSMRELPEKPLRGLAIATRIVLLLCWGSGPIGYLLPVSAVVLWHHDACLPGFGSTCYKRACNHQLYGRLG